MGKRAAKVRTQKLVAGSNDTSVRSTAGFTLIEMLVVLTIVALSLTLVVPAVSKIRQVSMYDVVRDMQISLRQARAEAVMSQQSALFWVDTQNYNYLDYNGKIKPFPAEINILASVAATEVDGAKAGVRFFPDGSSSGGHLRLSDADESARIEIDWLTGRVSLVDESRL